MSLGEFWILQEKKVLLSKNWKDMCQHTCAKQTKGILRQKERSDDPSWKYNMQKEKAKGYRRKLTNADKYQ